jgi:hypothetical protein
MSGKNNSIGAAESSMRGKSTIVRFNMGVGGGSSNSIRSFQQGDGGGVS